MARERREASGRIDPSRFAEKLRRGVDESRLLEPLDWVLLFLYAADGKVSSRAHLQKGLFILSRHIEDLGKIVEFNAYRMRQRSEDVSDALERAILSGFVSESRDVIELTERGLAKARKLLVKLDEKRREILKEVVSFVSAMSVEELLAKRREIAAKILLKGLVSAGLAAKIGG